MARKMFLCVMCERWLPMKENTFSPSGRPLDVCEECHDYERKMETWRESLAREGMTAIC